MRSGVLLLSPCYYCVNDSIQLKCNVLTLLCDGRLCLCSNNHCSSIENRCAQSMTMLCSNQRCKWNCFLAVHIMGNALKASFPVLPVLALPSVGALPLASQAAGKVKHFFKGTSVWHQGALWARTVLLWALDGASEGADSFPCSGGDLPPSPCSGLSSLSSRVKAFSSHLFVCT